jgi:hypothetical protein
VREKGHILLEAKAIPDSRFFALRPLASRISSPRIWVEAYLALEFLRKNGTISGGMPPALAPEGDLVFRGKPSCPLNLLTRWNLHSYNQLGCWACK